MDRRIKRPIRVRVVRPKGLAVTDAETAMKANEEMERLACEAIHDELVKKLRLLMGHYGIADKDDWFSLAIALATDHVPGFQIEWPLIDSVPLPPDLADRPEHKRAKIYFWGPMTEEKKKGGRPSEWRGNRLDRLFIAVKSEKARHGIKTDREALARLARRREWSRPASHRGTLDQWIENSGIQVAGRKEVRPIAEEGRRGAQGSSPGRRRKFRKLLGRLFSEFSAITFRKTRVSGAS